MTVDPRAPTSPHDADEVTYAGVLRAAAAIAPVLPVTPAWSYPLLDEIAGASVTVKHENVQPTGAFKVRGGLALLADLDPRPAGLITASTGNHAQSVAYAARQAGLAATIVMPISAPANKIAGVRALGAEVVSHGPTMTEAIARSQELAIARGWRHVGNAEPSMIHGHGTVHLELLQAHPDLQAIYVPVGSGSSAAGACLVRDAIAPGCRIVGVQSVQAPAAYDSWRAGELRTAACTTRASGLATAGGFDLPQRVLRKRLDDFLLVDDEALDAARRLLATVVHTLAEGAGAAGLAGLLADPRRPARCAVILSGGNADAAELATIAG